MKKKTVLVETSKVGKQWSIKVTSTSADLRSRLARTLVERSAPTSTSKAEMEYRSKIATIKDDDYQKQITDLRAQLAEAEKERDARRERKIAMPPKWYKPEEIRSFLWREGYPTWDKAPGFFAEHFQKAFDKGWLLAWRTVTAEAEKATERMRIGSGEWHEIAHKRRDEIARLNAERAELKAALDSVSFPDRRWK